MNQYTQRTIPSAFDVLGLATAANSVTVNGSAADYRRGEYFQESVSVSNGSGAVWQSVTVNAGTASTTGNQFVAQTPESPLHDLDGNTTNDGRWVYTWDGENRLIAMESLSSAPSGSKRKLTFEYDWMGRRIGKKVYIWTGSAYPGTPNTTLKFLYDGWNLMAELDGANATVRTYQWGLDLSGSLQGAGGVGGLLTVKPTSGIAQFHGYDGNGNVMLAVDGTSGARSAEFEYGPFGETLRTSGTGAATCLHRLSTKCQDTDSAMYYYGYRYYDPSMGRWINRDPLNEYGSENLLVFLNNSSNNRIDYIGLCDTHVCGPNVTSWLQGVLNNNVTDPRLIEIKTLNTPKSVNGGIIENVIVNGIRRLQAAEKFTQLVQTDATFDFKRFLEPDTSFDPAVGSCPTAQCSGSVTLCNICLPFDSVANIHFATIGRSAGFTDSELYFGSDLNQRVKITPGIGDTDADRASIEAGLAIANGGRLCDVVKRLAGRIRSDKPEFRRCIPCTKPYAGPYVF